MKHSDMDPLARRIREVANRQGYTLRRLMDGPPIATIAEVQEVVAEHFGIPLQIMREPDWLGTRATRYTRPRQAAMALSRQLTQRSYATIGKMFGGRDHTTVIHARKVTARRRDEDRGFDADLSAIEERLGA